MDRIIVTGSRDWADIEAIESVLTDTVAEFGKFLLVQGDCESGADAIAKAWAIRVGCEHEDVPADWYRLCDANCYHKRRWKNGREYCPMAGHLRNQVMVDRGARLVLAFPLGMSPGTRDCMARARLACIPVLDYESAVLF